MVDVRAARGSIATSLVRAVIETAVSRGAQRAPLEALIEGAGDRVGMSAYLAVWEAVMRAVRRPGLPMEVAQQATLDRFGLFGYALYVSRTLGEAMRRMARYHDVMTDSGTWSLTVGDTQSVVAWDRPGPRTLGMRVANEQILAAFVAIFEKLNGTFPVDEVHFRHAAPEDISVHERLFRARLRFESDRDAVVVATSLLEQSSPGFDQNLEKYFIDQIEAAVTRIAGAGRVTAQVSREILRRLPDGIPTAAAIAKQLGLSDRTLRRRLAEEKQTFEALVVASQRDRADELLSAGRAIGEIALAVGFADTSSFTRAYRRWTGRAPSRAR